MVTRAWIKSVRGCQSCTWWSAETGKMGISLSAFAPARNWSREPGSAVPSPRVSLLISILRLNLVLTYGLDAQRRQAGHPPSGKGIMDTNRLLLLLRKAGVAHVDRRLLRYYLIVRRLPNVFTLACRSLGSIYYDTGSPRDGKTPFGWLHPCRLVTDSRRYLIIGAPATMPLHSSFIFTLNNRASTIS